MKRTAHKTLRIALVFMLILCMFPAGMAFAGDKIETADQILATASSDDGTHEVDPLADVEEFTFEVTTTTANETFSIPLNGRLGGTWSKSYDWEISWGDGSAIQNEDDIQNGVANNAGQIDHEYASPGTYMITIKPNGSLEAWLGAFGFASGTDGANAQANRDKVTRSSALSLLL